MRHSLGNEAKVTKPGKCTEMPMDSPFLKYIEVEFEENENFSLFLHTLSQLSRNLQDSKKYLGKY